MKRLIIFFLFTNFYAFELREMVVCRKIINKNPFEADTVFKSGVGWLYCWCNLKTEKPGFIYHEWVYKDSVMARIKLSLKFSSKNYRIWSKKRIFSLWIGDWTVRIKNEKDSVLKEVKFKITE